MERTCFDVLADLFERDVDVTLLRRSLAKTPDERPAWLEEMPRFAEDAKKARLDEAPELLATLAEGFDAFAARVACPRARR